jgi:manganese/zinc/iron transport system permease protein
VNALQAALEIPAVTIVAVGALVGVAAALLGVFLVLRRESLQADAISHSVLLGIVLAWLAFGTLHGPLPLLAAAVAGLATVALTHLLTRSGLLHRDAAIGLVFPALFAAGVLLINLYARDVHIDTDAVLLGEIAFAWLDVTDVFGVAVPISLLTMGAIALIVIGFVTVFFKELTLATFDPPLAFALGFRPGWLSAALLSLLSVTAVGAFDAVGAILFVAFVIVPPAAAYLLTDRLIVLTWLAAGIAVASAAIGYAAAVALDVSIGGGMASATGLFFAFALLFGRHGLRRHARHRTRRPLTTAEGTQ